MALMVDPTARSGPHRRPSSERVCSHGAVPQWSIVVPAKRLAVAKTRLRPLTDDLGAAAHDELVLALLADTVAAAVACPAVAEVLVVTDEPAAADAVGALGVRTLPDEPDRGLNAALEHGARHAAHPAVAALSSDLPALRPAELTDALRAADAAPRCFVPDAHGTGTTLLTAAGTALLPRFGPASAQAHRDGGAVPLTGAWPGLVRDVDTPGDLRDALALGAGPRTASFARRLEGQAPR
jgi:2-phospho-L-lactate/phosphoenolpyruvate guanylyltransferase